MHITVFRRLSRKPLHLTRNTPTKARSQKMINWIWSSAAAYISSSISIFSEFSTCSTNRNILHIQGVIVYCTQQSQGVIVYCTFSTINQQKYSDSYLHSRASSPAFEKLLLFTLTIVGKPLRVNSIHSSAAFEKFSPSIRKMQPSEEFTFIEYSKIISAAP